MGCHIRKIFSWLLLLGALVLGMLLGLEMLNPPSAAPTKNVRQSGQAFIHLLSMSPIMPGFKGLSTLSGFLVTAAIRQLEEAPGQIVYQSRQTLKDQHGNRWQAIAFKRIRPNGQTSFELRLVGFPGVVEIDRSQPLTLTNSLGKTLTATDDSSNIFAESAKPEPNVGQYDLQPLLPQLQMGIPLKVLLPTISGEAVSLSISPLLIEEWQTVENYE